MFADLKSFSTSHPPLEIDGCFESERCVSWLKAIFVWVYVTIFMARSLNVGIVSLLQFLGYSCLYGDSKILCIFHHPPDSGLLTKKRVQRGILGYVYVYCSSVTQRQKNRQPTQNSHQSATGIWSSLAGDEQNGLGEVTKNITRIKKIQRIFESP